MKRRRVTKIVVGVTLAFGAMAGLVYAKDQKIISAKEARRVIARVAGIELKTDAVKIKNISAASASEATVEANVETALRFRKDDGDEWQVVEWRVGDRRWEELDLYASAIGEEQIARARTELGALVKDYAALQRERESQKEPLCRGAVCAKEFSSLLSSAIVVADVVAVFRLVKGGGKWRVAEIKVGGDGRWRNIETLVAATTAARNARVREELSTIKTALDAFRRERGFYVVADDHTVVIDHLSPRYLPRVIRLDPWQRPYRYEGTREKYVLRSDGADGVAGTADDVTTNEGVL